MAYTPTTYVDGDGKLYLKDAANHYWRADISTGGAITWTDTGTTVPTGTALVAALLNNAESGILSVHPLDANLGSVSGVQPVDFTNTFVDARVRLTLTGNATLNLVNVPPLAVVSIRCQQAAAGGPFTLTIQQSGATTTVKWDGGVAHVMSTTANAVDRIAGEKAATNFELGTVGKAYA